MGGLKPGGGANPGGRGIPGRKPGGRGGRPPGCFKNWLLRVEVS